MKESFIHDTANLSNCTHGFIKVYRNVTIRDTKMYDNISVGDDSVLERCIIEDNVAINRRSYFNDSIIGMFSYTGINTIMNYTKLGRFCSVGRNVDIGGFDHDYHKVTTMPEERLVQLLECNNPKHLTHSYCEIGSDVWIAAGVQILHKVKIGDGAVIGAGAVVTKDVPPYAIVVGVPAQIIGYRCSETFINDLVNIQWWNWPIDVIKKHINILIHSDINEDTISFMKEISKVIKEK